VVPNSIDLIKGRIRVCNESNHQVKYFVFFLSIIVIHQYCMPIKYVLEEGFFVDVLAADRHHIIYLTLSCVSKIVCRRGLLIFYSIAQWMVVKVRKHLAMHCALILLCSLSLSGLLLWFLLRVIHFQHVFLARFCVKRIASPPHVILNRRRQCLRHHVRDG